MEYIPSFINEYHIDELVKLNQLETLFKKWFKFAKDFRYVKDYSATDMVFDGFYPYYFKQKTKVLYIGREGRGLTGYNYIDAMYSKYKEQYIGNQHINASFFHKRLFYITYGLNCNFSKWSDIPWASDLTEKFATAEGISFAYMNISKFCNESEDWQSDWELIQSFYDTAINNDINFINKEIEILNPDVIITMNLGSEIIQSFGDIKNLHQSTRVNEYILKLNSKNALVLDTFHFTAPNKDDLNDFYNPILNACKKFFKFNS